MYVCLCVCFQSVLCKHRQHEGLHDLFGFLVCFSRLLCAAAEKPARVQRIFLFLSCLSFRSGKPFSTLDRPQRKSQQVVLRRSDRQGPGTRLGTGLISRAKWANNARAAEGSTGATPSYGMRFYGVRLRVRQFAVSSQVCFRFRFRFWVLDWFSVSVSVSVWLGYCGSCCGVGGTCHVRDPWTIARDADRSYLISAQDTRFPLPRATARPRALRLCVCAEQITKR